MESLVIDITCAIKNPGLKNSAQHDPRIQVQP